MAKIIRTKPSRTSRATLQELKCKGVLTSCMVGIRNIIRAATGEVDERGFEFWRLQHDAEQLANFQLGMAQYQAWVSYNGGRAHLSAVTGRSGWRPIQPDFHTRFPVNQIAGQLIQGGEVRGGVNLPEDGLLYGDAVLVTDVRRHWILSCRQADEGEVELFHEGLSTPRSLIKGWGGRAPDIFFHEEPHETDLFYTKLRFG